MKNVWSDRHGFALTLAAIVGIIAVMFSVIIGAFIFYAFIDAGETTAAVTDTFTVVGANGTTFWFSLSKTPAINNPGFALSVTDGVTDYSIAATNYSYVSSNNTVWNDNIRVGNTSATVQYHTQAMDTMVSVGTYAIIIFTMLALVPLILVGAVMLRSLGFLTFGKGGL